MQKLQHFEPYSRQDIDDNDIAAVIDVLKSPLLTQGNKTIEFEGTLARYCDAKYALSLNSATSALYCAFRAIKDLYCKDKNKKYKIITTPISFVATTNMMIANDFIPIFCDINFDGNLNLNSIKDLIDEDTIAICSVDYAGKSVDIEAFSAFAKKHNLLWISDSSHALGAKVLMDDDFKNIGNVPDISIFSLHALKPITTAEGGALLTNNDEIFESCKLTRSHGIVKGELYNSDCKNIGFNFRMNEISATLGLSQLKKLDHFIQKRQEISSFYDNIFENNPYFYTNKIEKNKISTHHLYPIILDPKYICAKEDIVRDLLEFNVGTQVHYKPIYNFSFYKNICGDISRRNAEDFYRAELSIPNHQKLTLKDAKNIADIIFHVFEKYKPCAM